MKEPTSDQVKRQAEEAYRAESRRVFATLIRADARASYQGALALVKQELVRRFLEKRLHELG